MNDTFNINFFEIYIEKQDDSIIIRCLDKQLFKVYLEIFDIVTIDDLCPVGLDNFYEICKNNFQLLQNNQNQQNNNTIFLRKQNEITININYKTTLTFTFVLKLSLQKNAPISGVELCVKKLEKDIDEMKLDRKKLENRIKCLEEKINNLCTEYFN
jgi:hypothetical protein